MGIVMRGAVVLVAASVIAACGTAQTAGWTAPAVPFTPAFNSDVRLASDCWARLYEREDFQGRSLSISGPARISNLAPYWGFPWDPRYESLAVGSSAALSLFEDPNLRDKSVTFKAGTSVRDLDKLMGVFRQIRSVQVMCVE